MTRPLRPLTADQRHRLTADLRALADELDRPDAGRTQQNLGVAVDAGYSATASGSGAGGGGGGGTLLTVVEARADRTDPTASATVNLLAALHRLLSDVGYAYDGLAEWRGDRPVALCPEGHVLERSSSRCTWSDPVTGRRCGTRRETVRTCENPYHVNHDGEPVRLLVGEKRITAIALDLGGIEVAECRRCGLHRRRTQRSWGDVARLGGSALVTELGTFHSEEPWAEELPSAG